MKSHCRELKKTLESNKLKRERFPQAAKKNHKFHSGPYKTLQKKKKKIQTSKNHEVK